MLSMPWTWRRSETALDYASAVIPLDEAHQHSHSYRLRPRPESGRRLGDEGLDGANDDDVDDDDDGADKDGNEGDTAMLVMTSAAAEYSIEGLRKEVRRGRRGENWTAYEMKSKLINKAIQDIGMGRYNWQLFVLCGFGWFADNLWMQGVSLTLPSLSAEFEVSEKSVRYTTSSLFVGLCLGSFFWGIGSDILGRRIAFNLTLLITSVFGTAAAYASSWAGVCLFSLLTLLSVWWPVGQLCSSLFAWFFIANWPVDQGWRLFVKTIGIITFVMFLVRFFLFHMFESPKYLLSRGRQAEAVAVVQGIALKNGRKTWLTEEVLDAVVEDTAPRVRTRLSTKNIIRNKLASFSAERIRPLFNSRKLGLTTALIWFSWATIGMGYPLFNAFLPQYLSHGGSGGGKNTGDNPPASEITGETYRSYAITSIAGVPGSLLAAHSVDMKSPFLGRRGTLAISTLVSAVFLFLFVQLGQSPASQLAFSCVEAFAQNIMYGVLYAFTPEIFPAPVRGAGTGVASFLNRATGLLAPIIAATVPGDGTTAPVYLSAALILAAFLGICMIPIETRGRQRL
ncbi:major facilitator superfamily domain-containing protein [Corynascus novoguineensis]|uniref:Major facilitator superfamily domain-containing protein n=1 Tax=Corynascus novoguineensis TaxID=1126955 RepID=A0AAN7HRT5_9PEZI|nr:major facilitator superfamily domain-containing protein [Corynascus novoguineensis]